MAYRKRVPQLRPCAVCGAPILTAHQRRCYCSGACNTQAWRLRHADAVPAHPKRNSSPAAEVAGVDVAAPASALAPADAPSLGQPVVPSEPVLDAPQPAAPSFGKLVAATTLGTLLADSIKHLVTAPASPAPARPAARGLPSWPPPALLAAAGPLEPITNPTWPELTGAAPVRYQRHQLYLCVVAGVTKVLWQSPQGEWVELTTPADLARLVAPPAPSASLQALINQYVPSFGAAPLVAPVTAPVAPPLTLG